MANLELGERSKALFPPLSPLPFPPLSTPLLVMPRYSLTVCMLTYLQNTDS